jgi:putative DNA primase/helicase
VLGKDFKSIIENNIFPLVPLVNYSKIPVVPWKNKDFWIKDSIELEDLRTTYKKEIDGKSKGGNFTGLSLICGKVSNIMVLDIDMNHGDNAINGNDSFNNFIKDLPEEDKEKIFNTFTVKTPRGGTHLYFKYKEGLRNKANYIPSVDIRTDGGLIVVPHSKVRINGEIKEYKADGQEIQEMPQQLFEKLIELDKKETKEVAVSNSVSSCADIMSNSKYYKTVNTGERDSALVSWLGLMIRNNPNMRTKETLLPQAITYNRSWFNPPLSNEEVEKKVDSILKYAFPSYCDDKGNIDNWNLVQHIIKEQPSYTKGNLWYLYNTDKGFYDYKELRDVQKMFFSYAINNKDKTVTRSKNFAELLMINSDDARKIHDEKSYINCLNGIIDIENNQLLPHDPKYKLEIQFQANYILDEWEEKFNNSDFKKFLETTLDEGSILALQESWGLMLSPHAREVQNAFIYKGEGSNGKSAAFDIQEALINDNRHICSIGLGDFGEPFVISMAEGKHVNIVRDDELSGKTVNKFFKSMVCGEPVTVNKKNKDLVRLDFNMTMFFALNRMPSAADKSTGFFRRPVIIPFNISFGTQKEVDNGLRDKVKDVGIADRIIENELDIVFMWSYKGLKRVKSNKWKVTISEESEREMEEYKEEVDSAYSFFKTKISNESKKDTRIEKDKIYNAYRNWCIPSDITPMNKVQFGRQFKSFGVKDIVSNSVRYWLNIELDTGTVKEVKDNIYPFV